MEAAPCCRALGLHELPKRREEVEAAYEAKRKTVSEETESGKLAGRLLEENYRACLELIHTKEREGE